MARDGPAHRTSATRMNSAVRLRSGGRRRDGSVQLRCSADGQPIQVTTPIASVPAKRAYRFDARWIRAIRRRWWRVAPDRHAPGMARGERPWMARASPAQHTATSAVISAPHPQASAPINSVARSIARATADWIDTGRRVPSLRSQARSSSSQTLPSRVTTSGAFGNRYA